MTAIRRRAPRRVWLRMFGVGLALWVACAAVTYLTGNPHLIPTLVQLGSFLVPMAFVSWAFEQRDSGELTAELVFRTFVVGGVLGVLGASVLEFYLLYPAWWTYLGVGLIEEAVKLAALALLTRRLAVKSMRDGLILGASVGFGFAAFESTGYVSPRCSPRRACRSQLVTTELLRGLVAPVGHGLWTAILGGLLFTWSTRSHFVLTGRLVLAYLGVSLLHALWDSMPSIATAVTFLLTDPVVRYEPFSQTWLIEPTAAQVRLYTTLTWVGLVMTAVIGLLWLWRLVLRARHHRHGLPPGLVLPPGDDPVGPE